MHLELVFPTFILPLIFARTIILRIYSFSIPFTREIKRNFAVAMAVAAVKFGTCAM